MAGLAVLLMLRLPYKAAATGVGKSLEYWEKKGEKHLEGSVKL